MAIEVLDVQFTEKMAAEKAKQESTVPVHIEVDKDVVYFNVSDRDVPVPDHPGLARTIKGVRYVVPKSEIRDLLGSL